jgi:hypothetical protein
MKRLGIAALAATLSIACAFAHAQSQGSLGGSKLSGGMLGKVTLTSAEVLKNTTLTSGSTKVELKRGDRIEGLTLAKADLSSGTASGGKWQSSGAVSVDPARKTATVDSISGTALRGAILIGATVDSGTQKFKVRGEEVSGDFGGQTVDLNQVAADGIDVQKAVVEMTAIGLGSKPAATTTISDVSLEGDTFILKSNLPGFARPGDKLPGSLTAMKDACFYVSSERADPDDPAQKRRITTGSFKKGWGPNGRFHPPYTTCPENIGDVVPDEIYEIQHDTLFYADRWRYGLTGGVLVAPFKFYLSTHNFSAGASVGPYVGYRFRDDPTSQSVLAFSLGLTSATVKTNNPDGTSTTTEKNGVSTALALIFEFKRNFSTGVMIGWDFFSKSDDIPNAGKPWLSISLGAKL